MERILIIEDDKQALNVFSFVLVREGYEVFKASNGKEGMKLYRENSVDLIITDIIMPDKEGLETIMEFKQKFPGIKIIAISGGGRIGPADYLRMAKALGAQRTLAKPFGRDELVRVVKEVLFV